MLKRKADTGRLLQILAECPDGVTQRFLVIAHGFAPSLLYRCIEHNLVRATSQVVSARDSDKSVTVVRFYITEHGRDRLRHL